MILTDLPVEYMDAFNPPSPELSDEDRARIEDSVPVKGGWQQYVSDQGTTTWAEPLESEYCVKVRLSLTEWNGSRLAQVELVSDVEPWFATKDADDLRQLARWIETLADLMEGEL